MLLGLLAVATLYAFGARRIGRGRRWTAARRIQALAFWCGWATLAIALISPLHRLGATLLSAHMAQHELLMIVAAPLLAWARALAVMLWALPPSSRRAIGRGIARLRPAWRAVSRIDIAWLLHAAAIIVWHVPALYDRTLVSEGFHALQHTSFLVTALLFWWSVLPAAARSRRHGPAILSLFSTMVYTGGLGALLTLSRTTWYPGYGDGARLWGLTPLEDQQLAGLIMWVPGSISYLLATLWLMAAWLRASERQAMHLDRPGPGPIRA